MSTVRGFVVALTVAVLLGAAGCASRGELQEVKQQKAGDYVVALLAPGGRIEEGKNEFALEFRKASDNQPVDVGEVQVSASMPMPGQPTMIAPVSASKGDAPGRYRIDGEFEMRGAWDLTAQFANGQKVEMPLKVQ